MFKIVNIPEFSHDIPIQVPVDGGHKTETLRARFRVLLGDGGHLSVEDFLKKIFIGAENLTDEAGNAVPWSDAVRDQLIDMPFVRAALMQAYTNAVTKARAGN